MARRMMAKLQRQVPVLGIFYFISVVLLWSVASRIWPESTTLQQRIDMSAISEDPVTNRRTEQLPPHIILIVVDDLGWDDVGYHGSDILTPRIDELAMTGVRLENYYVQRTCTPSRASLLTGKYDIHLGLQLGDIDASVPGGLPADVRTLPQQLKTRGYSTHLVGKWHMGYHTRAHLPTSKGFDTFHGFVTDNLDYYTRVHCEHNANDAGNITERCGLDDWRNNQTSSRSDWSELDLDLHHQDAQYSTIRYTQRAMDIISDHPEDKPLFLMLSYQAASMPYQVPLIYEEMYSEVEDENRRKYAGMITCLDDAISNLTKSLHMNDYWENTIIIFTTDNGAPLEGAGSNWPLRGGKGSLWEGGLRGIGFVSGPKIVAPGREMKELLHITDWYPTLLHLAGTDQPEEDVDGYNMWRALSYGEPGRRKEIPHTIVPPEFDLKPNHINSTAETHLVAALRSGHWKLMTGHPGDGERKPPPELQEPPGVQKRLQSDPPGDSSNVFLYHLRHDPYELHNVAPTHPDVVKRLLTRLEFYQKSALPPIHHAAAPEADPKLHDNRWVPWNDVS